MEILGKLTKKFNTETVGSNGFEKREDRKSVV